MRMKVYLLRNEKTGHPFVSESRFHLDSTVIGCTEVDFARFPAPPGEPPSTCRYGCSNGYIIAKCPAGCEKSQAT
jgi:hypothetical protein